MHYMEIPGGIETRAFISDSGALAALPELLAECFPGKRPIIIADGNTWRAAGERSQRLCEEASLSPHAPIVLPAEPRPHPYYSLSKEIAAQLPEGCVPVAVGSGVINDLVKCAAGIRGIPYCCVATACSVDGYTSSGGAMSVDGLKKTVPCPAPYALLADTEVLRTAPSPMLASGYADLLTKVTGGADWIIAETLGIEPIDARIWSLVQDKLRDWLADCHDLGKIFEGLAATGYAMQLYRDSRPASGAEHLCSHVWEMEGLSLDGEEISHGFKVGIGLLATSQMHEFIIGTTAEEARAMAEPPLTREARTAQIDTLLERGCYGDGVASLALEKSLFGDDLLRRRELIWEKWETLRTRLKKQLIPSAELRAMMKKAECPTRFSEIGLDREQYLHGIRTAQLIRKRYTVLDMFQEAGLLETALARLIDA